MMPLPWTALSNSLDVIFNTTLSPKKYKLDRTLRRCGRVWAAFTQHHTVKSVRLVQRQANSKTKKSETELTASILKKKRSKTHNRLKERFLIRRNRT